MPSYSEAAAWVFNPWDSGWAAIIFVGLTIGASLLAVGRARDWGVLPAAALVGSALAIIYMLGAAATAGIGPMAIFGFVSLIGPAIAISYLVLRELTSGAN